jgi:hypothetical protein
MSGYDDATRPGAPRTSDLRPNQELKLTRVCKTVLFQ